MHNNFNEINSTASKNINPIPFSFLFGFLLYIINFNKYIFLNFTKIIIYNNLHY